MKLLLDSHVLIWAVDQPGKLSPEAKRQLEDESNELLIRAATVWEIAIKVGLEKLALSHPYLDWMSQALADLNATLLPITVEFAARQAQLPYHHRDPFDRLLAAQSLVSQITLVSAESRLDSYGIRRLW
jgi:PIN domain nuclease of toxin-antitoxin system